MSTTAGITDHVRHLARRHLPPGIRKPLGSLAGKFQATVIQWLQGKIFDLSGGRFKADGCSFVIPKDITSVTYRSCFLFDSYEAEERALVRSFVRPSDSILELGGCLGIVSCVTNRLLTDRSRHLVVEGNPFCLPTLHRNRVLNDCGYLVENCAVSAQPDATFYLHPIWVVGGTTQRKTSLPVRVPARSFKDLDNHYGPFCTLIMDIEGAELEVLAQHPEVLNHYRLVVVELHDWAIGEEGVQRCRELFTAAGLRFRQRAGITEAWERD